MNTPEPNASGWREAEVAAFLARRLPASPALARCFLAKSLPEGHPLAPDLPTLTPTCAGVTIEDGGLRVDVLLTHAAPEWTLLAACAVRAGSPLTNAHRLELDAWGRAAVADERVTGAVAVLISPARYARDRGRELIDACVTLENLADWSQDECPADARSLREACDREARAAVRIAQARAADHWSGYLAVAAELAAHLTMLPRTPELDRAREVLFMPSSVARLGIMPFARLRHRLAAREARLELSRLPAPAAALAGVIVPELPLDTRLAVHGEELHVWLPAPPIDPGFPTERQRHDVRHGLLALWRLRNWYAATARRWDDWIAAAAPSA